MKSDTAPKVCTIRCALTLVVVGVEDDTYPIGTCVPKLLSKLGHVVLGQRPGAYVNSKIGKHPFVPPMLISKHPNSHIN